LEARIGVMAAVLVAPEVSAVAVARLQPAFDAFCKAAPPGARLHITDAFKPGNEEWAAIARPVREEYFRTLQSLRLPIVYAARRHGVARATREFVDKARAAVPAKPSPIRVIGRERPIDDRIEDDLMVMLALRLGAYAEDVDSRTIDLLFDATDAEIAKRYDAVLDRVRAGIRKPYTLFTWNEETHSKHAYRVSHEVAGAPFPLDNRFLGGIQIIGKRDCLIFAADIVANDLYRLLRGFPADAPLNTIASIVDWRLKPCVWGIGATAIDDLI
jgi:hypothetical protein